MSALPKPLHLIRLRDENEPDIRFSVLPGQQHVLEAHLELSRRFMAHRFFTKAEMTRLHGWLRDAMYALGLSDPLDEAWAAIAASRISESDKAALLETIERLGGQPMERAA